jgi:hypothetical protein
VNLTEFSALDPSARTCYFCGAPSDPDDPDCVKVTMQPRDGTFGMWLCHAGCVLPSRHPNALGFRIVVGRATLADPDTVEPAEEPPHQLD